MFRPKFGTEQGGLSGAPVAAGCCGLRRANLSITRTPARRAKLEGSGTAAGLGITVTPSLLNLVSQPSVTPSGKKGTLRRAPPLISDAVIETESSTPNICPKYAAEVFVAAA